MTPYNPSMDLQPARIDIRKCLGINTFNADTEIMNEQLTVGYNIILDTIGKIKKRLGNVSVLDDPGGNVVVAMKYFHAPNVAERMLQIQGAAIYQSTLPLAESGSWSDVTGGVTITADQYATDIVIADDRAYVTNALDKVKYHNGSGMTEEGDENTDPPFCKVGVYHKNKLWLFNEKRRGTSTGDTDSYTATSGDKLKVIIDGAYTFDDIVMTDDADIDDAVASINAHTGFSARGIAWKDSNGYLRISSLTTGETSRVQVSDGTNGNGGECEDLFDGDSTDDYGQENPEWGYYSNTLATETFNRSTQVFKVESGVADEIMAALSVGDDIIIFKESSIHQLTVSGANATYWALRPIEKRYGCCSYYCAARHAGVLYYFSRTGLRTIGGKYDVLPMSKLVATTWGTINWDYITRSRMIIFDNKLFLSVPTGSSTYPNTVLVFDILTDAWAVFTGWNVGCWGIYVEKTAGQDSAQEEILMYGDANDGKVYKCFKSTAYTDVGSTAINMQIETKAFDCGLPDQYKRGGYFYLRIETEPGAEDTAITISASIDGGAYSELGTTRSSTRFPLVHLGRWKKIKFKIQHNSATITSQIVLDGYSVETYVSQARV